MGVVVALPACALLLGGCGSTARQHPYVTGALVGAAVVTAVYGLPHAGDPDYPLHLAGGALAGTVIGLVAGHELDGAPEPQAWVPATRDAAAWDPGAPWVPVAPLPFDPSPVPRTGSRAVAQPPSAVVIAWASRSTTSWDVSFALEAPRPASLRRLHGASGRSLGFIEDFIRDEVLPLYANTHTETSRTGLQTTRFREEARRAIHDGACGGGPDDVVIFCGAGATGAINKLIDAMNLRLPADLDAKYGFSDQIPADQRPVVFIGPYEHHSNELPWRESIADVVRNGEDADGHVCQPTLAECLMEYAGRPLTLGSFSAASNVTGIVTDCAGISALLHRHGALAMWDFAAAAPYVRIDMNPHPGASDDPLASRTPSSSRRTSSSAGRARPACWWPSAPCSATGCRRCRAAARSAT